MPPHNKIVLLAMLIVLGLPMHAIALPYTEPFTPVKHEVKQVVVYAKKETPIKMDCNALRPLLAPYDWDVEMAVRVSNLESGCDPTNHNYGDKHKTCMGSWNVFNVGCGHYKKGEDVNDMMLNIKKAHRIYKDSGDSFRAWTTCAKIKNCS